MIVFIPTTEETVLADKVNVELGGKSKYEVARQMADTILFSIEGKRMDGITRKEFLKAVEDCMTVLNGGSAPG
ncbi:hypothetical protein A1D31_30100 [Bradyrhizobium liaoningense]|nr:hypothetical protein A1D31_30100 [Bradyrhizobium liaoningense]